MQPPPGPQAARAASQRFAEAFAAFRTGRLADAERLCRALVAAWPRESAPRRLLGMVRQNQGEVADAIGHFAEAARLAPTDADAWSDYGQSLMQDGRIAEAAGALEHAVGLAPGHAQAQHNLGLALASQGDPEAAEAAFRRAVAIDPSLGGARLHLAHLVYDRDPAAAAGLLADAVRLMPGYPLARLHLSVLMDEAGREEEAAGERQAALARDPALAATVESHAHLRGRGAAARRCGSRFTLLRHALARAPETGLVLEFGVRWGVSARFLAGLVERLHGFDSLEGLPEEWRPGEGRGSYSTGGTRPGLPANVVLHAGWFEETLPRFLAEHPGPVRFAHIDCDIYESTRTVLAQLAPRLAPGAVLVFDEYHSYPGWREHEFRAFQEFLGGRGSGYEYLGYVIFGRQAAVRLL